MRVKLNRDQIFGTRHTYRQIWYLDNGWMWMCVEKFPCWVFATEKPSMLLHLVPTGIQAMGTTYQTVTLLLCVDCQCIKFAFETKFSKFYSNFHHQFAQFHLCSSHWQKWFFIFSIFVFILNSSHAKYTMHIRLSVWTIKLQKY